MDKESIDSLFDYHFEFNRRLFDYCVKRLSEKEFKQEIDYSLGSIRNLFVHIMSVDDRWFSGLRGVELPDFLDPKKFPSSSAVRQKWDEIESSMRDYLSKVTDAELKEYFVEDLKKWQVLFHVVNHGTNHRAQICALLNRFDIKANLQDYAMYIMGRI